MHAISVDCTGLFSGFDGEGECYVKENNSDVCHRICNGYVNGGMPIGSVEEESIMKILKSILLTIGLMIAASSSAYAHDSFSFGINIGGPGYYRAPPPVRYYAPPVVYYAPPPVMYYGPPPLYYRQAPAPHGYYRHDSGRYDSGPRGFHHGWR